MGSDIKGVFNLPGLQYQSTQCLTELICTSAGLLQKTHSPADLYYLQC